MKQRTIEVKEFYELCPECKKEVKGTSESQVKYNLSVHIKQKHKDGQ